MSTRDYFNDVWQRLSFRPTPEAKSGDPDQQAGKEQATQEVERRTLRYVPRGIDHLEALTKFNREELKMLYRNFKNDCPSGVISEDLFKEIYGQFFPAKGSDDYAHLVFDAFDHQDEGFMNFEEFAVGLSKLLRGNLTDKLQWAFNLYDINKNGFISKNEIYEVVKSIYQLLGGDTEQAIDDVTIEKHTRQVFEKLDRNCDDVITMGEFFESCNNNKDIIQSMQAFESSL